MRYSIMLQLVVAIALIFLGSAAMFAWLQYRPSPDSSSFEVDKKNRTANIY